MSTLRKTHLFPTVTYECVAEDRGDQHAPPTPVTCSTGSLSLALSAGAHKPLPTPPCAGHGALSQEADPAVYTTLTELGLQLQSEVKAQTGSRQREFKAKVEIDGRGPEVAGQEQR